MSLWKKYAYAWITAVFFLVSLAGHWIFGWFAYVSDQQAHHLPVDAGGYAIKMMRDTLENWQSEFLQLLWQVGGLALLLFYGSPQSKEGDDRKEEKLNEILRHVSPKDAEAIIRKIDRKFSS